MLAQLAGMRDRERLRTPRAFARLAARWRASTILTSSASNHDVLDAAPASQQPAGAAAAQLGARSGARSFAVGTSARTLPSNEAATNQSPLAARPASTGTSSRMRQSA